MDHDEEDNMSNTPEEGVYVSTECATFLFTASVLVGEVVVALITNLFSALLAGLGFASIGVEAGSAAAAWQSTFPLVPEGSFFSKLQSITMKGAGWTFGPGSVAGGAAALTEMGKVCTAIDNLDPESDGREILSNLAAVFRGAKSWAKDGWHHLEDEGEKILEGLENMKEGGGKIVHHIKEDWAEHWSPMQ